MPTFETELIAQVPRLRRYARALTGNDSHADDLVQDALERAWRRVGYWRPGSNLRAWLFTVMHNVFVNDLRRATRHGQAVSLDDHQAVGATKDGHEASRLVDELDRGLAGLSPEQREVLLLVALEGLSYEEVAGLLGIPIGTVMSRLFRARERMRQWLDGKEQTNLRVVK